MSAIPVLIGWKVRLGSLNGEHAHYAVPVVSQGEAAILGCGHGQWHIFRGHGRGREIRGRGATWTLRVCILHTQTPAFTDLVTCIHSARPFPSLRDQGLERLLRCIVGQDTERIGSVGGGGRVWQGVACTAISEARVAAEKAGQMCREETK